MAAHDPCPITDEPASLHQYVAAANDFLIEVWTETHGPAEGEAADGVTDPDMQGKSHGVLTCGWHDASAAFVLPAVPLRDW